MESRLGAVFGKMGLAASAVAAAAGLLGLLGWLLDARTLLSISPGMTVINPLVAIGLVVGALALWLQLGTAPRARMVGKGLGLVMALIGLSALSDAWLGTRFEWDAWLFREQVIAIVPPDGMAVRTALSFVLVGGALLSLDARPNSKARPAEAFALAAGLLSLQSLMAYAYFVLHMIDPALRPTALLAAIGLFALSAGVLFARPDLGLMRHVTSPHQGGRVLRRLLPAWLILPLGLAVLHQLARPFVDLDAFSTPQVEIAALALVLTYWTGLALNREDEARARLSAGLAEQEANMRHILSRTFDVIGIYEDDRLVYVNEAGVALMGVAAPQAILGRSPGTFLRPEAERLLARARDGQASPVIETTVLRPDGRLVELELAAFPIDRDGRRAVQVVARDITGRIRREKLLQAERVVLELIAKDAPLNETLAAITRLVEHQAEGAVATILLVDAAGKIHVAAAESLPPFFNRAVDGQPIGPKAGSCGTAAYLGKTVVTPDIAHDPLWEDYRAVAEQAGLAASWSTPLFASDGRVVGTLAQYYRTPQDPTPKDLKLTEVARHLAEIAIARAQADEALREARDELERRVVERTEALGVSEARLRAIVGHTPDAIYVKDLDGRYLLINQAGLSFLGLSISQVIGRRNEDLLDATTAETLGAHDRRVLETGAAETLEEVLTIEGEAHVFLSTKFPYRSDSGELLGLVGISRDVTERKAGEALLRQRERMMREAQALAHMGSWEWDMGRNEVHWSDELYRIYGLSPQEFGATFEAFLAQIRPEDREYVRQVVETSAATHAPYAIEERIIRPSGEERVLASSGRVEVGTGGQATRMWGICLDITERKRAEAEVHQLNVNLERRIAERTTQLEAANRELEAFSYSVSHDLRTPLRSIDGFSQALLDDYEPQLDETGKDYLRRVRAASQRMAQLIDDILQLSRLTRGELHWGPVDLSAIAREVAQEASERERGRTVDFSVQEGLVARGDARLLRAALENMIGNAWKFTAKHATAHIEVGAIQQEGQVVYFVRDDGAGFDMAYADKLFRPFSRLHTSTEFAGTGVGLATVQRIIHRHGGRIWAEGAPEHGATFFFTLEGGQST